MTWRRSFCRRANAITSVRRRVNLVCIGNGKWRYELYRPCAIWPGSRRSRSRGRNYKTLTRTGRTKSNQIIFLFYDRPFLHVRNLRENVFKLIVFHFNSWLSFQRLCRLLRGLLSNRQLVSQPINPYSKVIWTNVGEHLNFSNGGWWPFLEVVIAPYWHAKYSTVVDNQCSWRQSLVECVRYAWCVKTTRQRQVFGIRWSRSKLRFVVHYCTDWPDNPI